MFAVGSGSAKREKKKKSHPVKLSVDLKEFLERPDVTDQTNCNEELLHAEMHCFHVHVRAHISLQWQETNRRAFFNAHI